MTFGEHRVPADLVLGDSPLEVIAGQRVFTDAELLELGDRAAVAAVEQNIAEQKIALALGLGKKTLNGTVELRSVA